MSTGLNRPQLAGRPYRREQPASSPDQGPDRERAVLVDEPDQLPAHLPDQDHPHHVPSASGVVTRRPAAELAGDTQPLQASRRSVAHPPCTTTGRSPTYRRNNHVRGGRPGAVRGEAIAWPPYLTTMVRAVEARQPG